MNYQERQKMIDDMLERGQRPAATGRMMNYAEFLMKLEHSLEQASIAAGKLDVTAGSDLRKASAIASHMADMIENMIQYGRGEPELPDFPWSKFRMITSQDTITPKGDGELIPKLLAALNFPLVKPSIQQGTIPDETWRERFEKRDFEHFDAVITWTLPDLIINAVNGIRIKLGREQERQPHIMGMARDSDWHPDWYCPICGEPMDTDEILGKKIECPCCQTPASQFEPYPTR